MFKRFLYTFVGSGCCTTVCCYSLNVLTIISNKFFLSCFVLDIAKLKSYPHILDFIEYTMDRFSNSGIQYFLPYFLHQSCLISDESTVKMPDFSIWKLVFKSREGLDFAKVSGIALKLLSLLKLELFCGYRNQNG